MQPQIETADLRKADVLIAALAAANTRANNTQCTEIFCLLELAFSELLGEIDFYLLFVGAADRLGILSPRGNVRHSADTVADCLEKIRAALCLLGQQHANDSVVQLTQAILDQLTTLIGPRLTLSRLRSALAATCDAGLRAARKGLQ